MSMMAARTSYEAAFQRWLQEGGRGPKPRLEDYPDSWSNGPGPWTPVETAPQPLPLEREWSGIPWQGLPDFLRNLQVPTAPMPFDPAEEMLKLQKPPKGGYVVGPKTNWIQQAILRRSR